MTLLEKLVWSILYYKEKLRVQVLTHKYLKKKNLFGLRTKSGMFLLPGEGSQK